MASYLDIALAVADAPVAEIANVGERGISGISGISPRHEAPADWTAGVASLRLMSPPRGIQAAAWSVLVADAQAFLATWAGQAAALGWTAHDVFGAHRTRPLGRYDHMGLVPLLLGRPVVALTSGEAAIKAPRGCRVICRRREQGALDPDQLLVWEFE